jgi:sugar phosphate isomerase/epimerase
MTVTRAASGTGDAARDRGLTLRLEFHAGTLTADPVSTRRLLDDVGSPALFTAWQPPYWAPRTTAGEGADIGLLAPDLAHVHVYDWDADLSRHPLGRSEARWVQRLGAAAGAGERAERAGVPRSALIEFVPGDDPGSLATEVATLRRCLTTPTDA